MKSSIMEMEWRFRIARTLVASAGEKSMGRKKKEYGLKEGLSTMDGLSGG